MNLEIENMLFRANIYVYFVCHHRKIKSETIISVRKGVREIALMPSFALTFLLDFYYDISYDVNISLI